MGLIEKFENGGRNLRSIEHALSCNILYLFFGHFSLNRNNIQTAVTKHDKTTRVVKNDYASTYLLRSDG